MLKAKEYQLHGISIVVTRST